MMPTTRRFTLVFWILAASILVGAAAPPGVSAQNAPAAAAFSAPEGPALMKIQMRFDHGQPARIMGPEGVQVVNSPRITPRGVEWSTGSTAGQDSLADVTIVRWAELQRLQTRGHGAGTGAAIGAIGLGLLSRSAQSDPFLKGSPEIVLVVTAGGALLGAGIGALIGRAVPKWVNVHIGTPAR